MITKDIWTKGFEIEREGKKIQLTPTEIRDIHDSFSAANGHGSIEYYEDTCLDMAEDEMTENEKAEKEIIEMMKSKPGICKEIWHSFLDALFEDSGEIERDVVNMFIQDYIRGDR